MTKRKSEELKQAIEEARAAQQIALSAFAVSQTLGTIVESMLATLHANGVLPAAKLRLVFLGAAASIDEMKPADDMQRAGQHQMREMVVKMAKDFGIEIPPPGQTGMQRKH